mgnify:CR=1 FL=1
MARNSFIQISKLTNLKGRIDYITNPKRQENLYAIYDTADDTFWQELGKCNRLEFKKSGSAGSCIESRELIIALPEQFCYMNKQKVLEDFTKLFKDNYGVNCIAALHHNKTKTNLHIHLIFAEREELKDGVEKIATRNMFYDENDRHVRTKKEILDSDGNIRKGCSIIKKGEIYEYNRFSKKKAVFKARSFLKGVKELYTEHINLFLEDKDKLQVFSDKDIYLPTKKVGKNNPKAEEIKKLNEARTSWNSMVDEALYCNVPRAHIKTIKDTKISRLFKKAGSQFTKVKGGIKHNQSSRDNGRVSIFSLLFLEGVELAKKCLAGLVKIYKAATVPKSPYPEVQFKEMDKAFDLMMNAHREGNYCSSKIRELEDRISRKDYKMFGGKRELQEQIKSLEEQKSKYKNIEVKMLRVLGFTNVRDAESEFGRMRTVMSAYESKVEDALWAKENLEKDVQYYMKNLDSIESDARDIDMERRKALSR